MLSLTPSLLWTNSQLVKAMSFINRLKTWADANAYAQSIGRYLVKIDSATENSDLFSRLWHLQLA